MSEVITWKVDDWHPYPWRFAVVYEGRRLSFTGIPNYCETKRAATMRAWWRLKWLKEGTFDQRYV